MTASVLRVFVAGRPQPQGSKTHKGRGVMVESAKGLPAWRKAIITACLGDDNQPRARFAQHVPVRVVCMFVMPRTTRLRKTGPTPPHTVKPDVDKLLRAVGDALTIAGVLHDDAQVVEAFARKRYAEIGETPGAHLSIYPDPED